MTRARIAFHIFWQRHKKGGGGEAGVRGNRPHIPDPDCYDQVLRAERGYYAVNESNPTSAGRFYFESTPSSLFVQKIN